MLLIYVTEGLVVCHEYTTHCFNTHAHALADAQTQTSSSTHCQAVSATGIPLGLWPKKIVNVT